MFAIAILMDELTDISQTERDRKPVSHLKILAVKPLQIRITIILSMLLML